MAPRGCGSVHALRVGVFVSLLLTPGVVLAVWAASAEREVRPGAHEREARPGAQPYDGGQRVAVRSGGRPKCVRVGTRSEGWAWPSGKFIRWAKCKGVTPKCHIAGAGRKDEGWYARTTFIAPDRCSERGDKER